MCAARKELRGEITAFYALSLPEFHMPPHCHDSFEIMYVTAGSCTVFCGGEEHRIEPHHFVFLNSRVSHRLEVDPRFPCSILNMEFRMSASGGNFDLSELLEKSGDFQTFRKEMPPFLCSTDLRNLGYSLKDLIAQLQKTPDSTDFLLYLLFARVMTELAFSIIHRKENAGLLYLKKACSYIEEHLHEEIRVPELAAFTGINKSYLQSLFSRFSDCSIIEYVNRKRLDEAAFLLTNSSMSITDIAFATGYNSRQHFAHTFQKYHGLSPLAYRKLHGRTITADTGGEQYVLKKNEISRFKLAASTGPNHRITSSGSAQQKPEPDSYAADLPLQEESAHSS